MENEQVRRAARAAGMPLWKLAEELGISEATLSRWLRKPLPDEIKQQALNLIRKYETGVS